MNFMIIANTRHLEKILLTKDPIVIFSSNIFPKGKQNAQSNHSLPEGEIELLKSFCRLSAILRLST